MSEKLTKEQVLHVADLGRLYVTDTEVEKYQVQLKQIWNEIEKINKVDIDEKKIMINPIEEGEVYRSDNTGKMLNLNEVLENAPSTNGNYISVPRVLND